MLRFARDGANYTTRAVFDCYYNPEDESYVVIDYQPKRWLNLNCFYPKVGKQIFFCPQIANPQTLGLIPLPKSANFLGVLDRL